MMIVDDEVVWSASDLTSAASCEYAFLRRLDEKRGRVAKQAPVEDALQDQIAKLGLAHESRVLARFLDVHGEHEIGRVGGVRQLAMATSTTRSGLQDVVTRTADAFAGEPDVVFQAGFFDGEFHGHADFVRRTPDGWVVADTKIARTAKVSALLQVAAYADQLDRMGLDAAPTVEIILGTGAVAVYSLDEIMPVFRERRARLRHLVERHGTGGQPTGWYDSDLLVCGSCNDCSVAAEAHQDLVLVANMRMAQREKLRAAGITTVAGLAAADTCPPDLGAATFHKLRAQAAMQLRQLDAEAAGTPEVFSEVFDPKPILSLPAPSPGDLFFDFEGDPMFHVEGSDRWGLEYLWGVQPANGPDGEPAEFWHLWADSPTEEREALTTFLDRVAQIRAEHPGMHVYHYAPYEVTALKKLVAVYKTHEEELDDLLRHGVFVDLYATVRAAVRISQPSYSIKKLEPLYMAERVGEVMGGDVSIVEYQAYRDSRGHDDGAAEVHRRNLVDYNTTDCFSTLLLRDWLLGQVDAGQEEPTEVVGDPDVQETRGDDPEVRSLRSRLLSRSGPVEAQERTSEQQAWAMLESALGYYKREDKPFWWAHFDRLRHEPDEWAGDKDVLVVQHAEVVEDWGRTGGQRASRRRLRLTGQANASSTLEVGSKASLIYDLPGPEKITVPVDGLRGWVSNNFELASVESDGANGITVELVETNAMSVADHGVLPIAVAPDSPPKTASLQERLMALAQQADRDSVLPEQAGVDVLLRQLPRLAGGVDLAHTGDPRADLVSTLRQLDRSYLAVQGPPGTGKTYVGSRVIADLVRDHGWKIGVVGQSHAVVENMLSAVINGGGLDPDLVGKLDNRSGGAWRSFGSKKYAGYASFAADRATSGFVFGGTAWALTNKVVEPDSLDLLVIDEAGQFSLASMLAVSVAAKRLLLLGDPQQLPQVSQGTHGEPVNDSALSWIMDGHATMPRDRGYFLETSYRMHPDVCAPVSRLAYDGKLHPAPAAAARDLTGVRPGLEVVRLAHSGNSGSSPEEAAEVVQQIERLMGRMWSDPSENEGQRPLSQHDFLVVAPYNAQRQLIRRRLEAAGLDEVRVGTVDKFQGQQAPVVLVSMTASSAAEVPRGLGFLLSRQRVNVAVSRAQWLAVLVRGSHLTAHVPGTPEELLELGAFVGLCEAQPGADQGAL